VHRAAGKGHLPTSYAEEEPHRRANGAHLCPLAGAERSSAVQGAVLALVMPTHKRHFARGLQPQGSSAYRRAKLFESDRPA